MPKHRMVSKRVVGTAKFLRMPLSSQALYFHLNLEADDDGVVEAFGVLRTVGASEDDLNVLIAKQFVIVLSKEELVCYIAHWQENNKIRADRKIDSIYKDLLVQIVPEVPLVEAKPRADTGKRTGERRTSKNEDLLDIGLTMDGQWTAQDKIRQDKIRQDKLIEAKTDAYPPSLMSRSIIELFDRNVHPIVPLEAEKLIALAEEVGENVVKEAILSAVTHHAHTLVYVETAARGIASGTQKKSKNAMPF